MFVVFLSSFSLFRAVVVVDVLFDVVTDVDVTDVADVNDKADVEDLLFDLSE